MITIGTTQVQSARLIVPWVGAWICDLSYDLPGESGLPSGRVTLKFSDTVLVGTVDPRRTGKIGTKASVRVVAGAGAWDSLVPPKHWHNDAGVSSSIVLATTAGEVGETIADGSPSRLGVDFARTAGPASSVFGGAWWVDFAGVTHTGNRPAMTASPDVLNWDPVSNVVELVSDVPLAPGFIVTDSRFGSLTVRDIEQSWESSAGRVRAWCGDAPAGGGKLASALKSIARVGANVDFLKSYRYRVVLQGIDGRLTLQAVSPTLAGIPDQIAISVWPGMTGLSAKVLPGTIAILQFLEGDPSRPVVTGFEESTPLELDFAAALAINLKAVKVSAGTGSKQVAFAAPLLAWADAVTAACAANTPPIVIAPATTALHAAVTSLNLWAD